MTNGIEPRTLVQWIRGRDGNIALLVRGAHRPATTEFLTPAACIQQLGFVVHPRGAVVAPHTHRATERRVTGMSELLMVREGRCEVDLYDAPKTLVATLDLMAGDLLLMVAGGHGVRMTERCVILEMKQGPFTGPDDKVLLTP